MGRLVLEGKSVREAFFTSSRQHLPSPIRAYLKRYKACESAADVTAAQESIMAELKKYYEDSRRDKGGCQHMGKLWNSKFSLKDAHQTPNEDLLVANPNHQLVESDESDNDNDEETMYNSDTHLEKA